MNQIARAARPADLSQLKAGHLFTPNERKARGKALRDTVPLESHAAWTPYADRVPALEVLQAADRLRDPRLIPLRYGRMLGSPFPFYRGSAGVMAADLARTPATGIHVQACGDCHLLNFGGFATPERQVLFDINDLDETLPAPWEWDVKRLVASFVLAAQANGFGDAVARDLAVRCARAYRKAMRAFCDWNVLDIWYASMGERDLIPLMPADRQDTIRARVVKAMARNSSELVYPELVDESGGGRHIRDRPPTLFHPEEAREAGFLDQMRDVFAAYRETLAEDRRILLDRYRLEDVAIKVVGIGSVGTACSVVLLTSLAGDPLFLQVKQANASVLEPYAGASAHAHHGQRVVMGQRLIQPASDIFLGWVTDRKGRHLYVRQLRDAKIKPLVETFDAPMLAAYAKVCGWVLARAHAKAGDPWMISGYLGKQDVFDEAMGGFAIAYADQAARDHATLREAVRAGQVAVQVERD